jgi:hypothetical protein
MLIYNLFHGDSRWALTPHDSSLIPCVFHVLGLWPRSNTSCVMHDPCPPAHADVYTRGCRLCCTNTSDVCCTHAHLQPLPRRQQVGAHTAFLASHVQGVNCQRRIVVVRAR